MAAGTGYVYIAVHTSGTTVKVGETSRSPQARVADYSEVYQLKGFSLHKSYEVPMDSRQDVEEIAHRKLRKFQLSGIGKAREIFSCSPEIAEKAVSEAIEESTEVFRLREIEEIERQLQEERERQEQIEKERIRRKTESAEETWLSSQDKREWDRNQTLIRDYTQRSDDGAVSGLTFILSFTNSLAGMMIFAGLLMAVFAQHYELLLYSVVTLAVGGAAWKGLEKYTGSDEIPRLEEKNARLHARFIQRYLDE